ncbi:NAD(P)H-dependent oxidoreductase [Secundilactobacillus hailunensis]|uniref:NAD(P)H-dependent oxidoreductase n=1 Tax=Secundilactobacillus hailunensis TaxID=2559923 RepID=A0ABW1T9D5_9LACO|nr:NADPH-dependent FMN reductase [Secundilactobacillus hailunensis]
MNLIALVGTNTQASYSSKLLSYLQAHFSDNATIMVCEISGLPLFSAEESETPAKIHGLANLITASDGVVIATPEFNQAVPAALNSSLAWLSWQIHPLRHKPVMLIGVSSDQTNTDSALTNLRNILTSPNIDASVFNQFTLKNVQELLAENKLTNSGTLPQLETQLTRFITAITNGSTQIDSTSGASKHTDATAGASQKPTETPDYSSDLDQPATDSTSGASKHTDATAGASQKPAEVPDYSSDLDQPATDSTSGASEHTDATAGASQKPTDMPDYSSDLDQPTTDSTSGASEHTDATAGASQKPTDVPDYSSDLDRSEQTDATTGASAK